MVNVEIRRMGLIELVELKRKKEQNLWTLGFRLASRELFDIIVEIEREIELRLEQIKELRKLSIMEILPGITQEEIELIDDLMSEKEFQMWLND